MKSTALVVLVALFTASDFGVHAIQNHNVQRMETETLTDKKKQKKTAKAKKHAGGKKSDAKPKAAAKKEEPKDEAPKEEAPEDETETSTAVEGGAMSGADEDEIIDRQYNLIAKEAMNAAGVSTGEKVVFKEDAIAAGKKIIKSTKGLKGKKLDEYMKEHFEETWKNYDVNDDGSISLEESHVF